MGRLLMLSKAPLSVKRCGVVSGEAVCPFWVLKGWTKGGAGLLPCFQHSTKRA